MFGIERPNITGGFCAGQGAYKNTYGVFSRGERIIGGGVNTYPQNGCYPFDFSATNSSSLYHDSKVQPSAFQALIIIKVWSAAGCTVFKSLNTELELLAFIFTDLEPVAYEPLATRSKYSVPMLFEKTPFPCIWYTFWNPDKLPTFSIPVMFGNAQSRTSRDTQDSAAMRRPTSTGCNRQVVVLSYFQEQRT